MSTTRPASAATAPDPDRGVVGLAVQRRAAVRRAADRAAVHEAELVARAIDALRTPGTAEERLARVLRLTALTGGAAGAAIRLDAAASVVAAWTRSGDPEAPGEAGRRREPHPAHDPRRRLAGWLAAAPMVAPGSRPVVTEGCAADEREEDREHVLVLLPDATDSGGAAMDAGSVPGGLLDPSYVMIPVPDDRAAVALAFAGPAPADAATALPASLLRHVSLAASLLLEDHERRGVMERITTRDDERAELLGTVAHELRTPLASIAGYLDLLLDDRVDEPGVRREFLQRSRGVVASMGELIGDLLDLARVRAGVLPIHVASFSAADAARGVCDALLPQALAGEIGLEAALGPRLRAVVADRRRTEQVLLNLVGNALKFSRPGGHVRVAVDGGPGNVVFTVSDDGPGIDPDDHERIFERFERAGSAQDQGRVQGSGLGLAIARELLRAMGGEVGVASRLGAGATFVVALPGANSTPGLVRDAFERAMDRARARFATPAAEHAATRGPNADAIEAAPMDARATAPGEAVWPAAVHSRTA